MSRKAMLLCLLCAAFAHGGPAMAWIQATVVNPDGDTVYFHQPGNCVAWSLSLEGSSDIMDYNLLHGAVRQSFETWNAVSCSYVKFFETDAVTCGCSDFGYNQDGANTNLIAWYERSWPGDYPPEAVAITAVSYDEGTGAILDSDIAVNGDRFIFGIVQEGSCDGLMDVQSAVTHEAGHMLGFDDSDVPGATMYGFTFPCETEKRTLEDDDISGLCAMYPLASNPGVCDSPIGGLNDCREGCSGCSVLPDDPQPRSLMMRLAALLCFLLAVVMRRRFIKTDRKGC
jgi:hypothetical protein